MKENQIKDIELKNLITEMVIKSSFGRTLVYVLSKRMIVRDDNYPFPAAVGRDKLIINLNKTKELAQNLGVLEHELLSQIIFHECLHVALGHLERLPMNRLSNWAVDAPINKLLPLLNREPFVTFRWLSRLIGEPLGEELSAEEIYIKLLSKIEEVQIPTAGEGGNQEQDESEGEGEEGEGEKEGSSSKSCPYKRKGKGQQDGQDKGGGSKEGDQEGKGEPTQIDNHEELKKENGDPLNKEEMKKDLKKGIEAEMAKNPGSLPGELSKILELLSKPPSKWRKLLENIIGSSPSTSNPTYSRINRRDEGDEIVKPGKKLRQEKVKAIVVIDTSGSLWDNETFYQRVFVTFKKLVEEEIMEVEALILFDTQIVQVTKDWNPKKKVKLEGAGGTQIEPVIKWMEEHPNFDVGIVVTDGYWDPPKRWPKQKIVWIVENEEEVQIIKRVMRPDHRVVVFDEK
jgi:predicted metal-dependent peptidase